jgi:hypothetical protein
MPKIESLTAEQLAKLPEYRAKWLAIGLATGPSDEDVALGGIRLAYEAAGLPAPKLVIRLGSPMAGAHGAAILKNGLPAQVGDQVGAQVRDQVRDQVWAQVGAQVWAQVGDQVWDQVRDQVWDQVWAQVRAQVGDQVWAQVGAQVGDQVWAQVRAQVGDQVRAQVRAQVRDQVGAACYGSHDANWLGFYDFFQKEMGLKSCDKLNGLAAAASGGWFWPFAGGVVTTPRPSELHRDAQGRLHNEKGMAIKYPDGWGFYCIHGLGVPGWIVTNPEQITVAKIKAEANVEIRRVMIDIYGPQKYLHETKAKLIHADVWHGMPRGLFEDSFGDRYLYGSDGSTNRLYIMPVDREMQTCTQAHENISGVPCHGCIAES